MLNLQPLKLSLLLFFLLLAGQAYSQSKPEPQGTDSVYTFAEKMPQYPGGDKEMLVFLAREVKYPAKALKRNITGTTYILFFVNKDGSLSNFSIAKGSHRILDKEALRAAKQLPAFIPAEDKGKPVKLKMMVPIKFSIPAK